MFRLSVVTLALAFSGLVHSLPYSSGTAESFTNQTSTPTPISPSTADGSERPNSFTFATPSPSGISTNHNISGHREPHGGDQTIVTVTVDCASASMFTNVPVATGWESGSDDTGTLGKPTANPGDGDIPGGFISTISDASGPVVATPTDPAALPSESPLVPSSTSEFSEPVITSSSISDAASATSDIPEPVTTNSISDAAPSSDSFTNEPEIASSVSLVSDSPLSTTTLGARDDQGNSSVTISEAVSLTNIPSSVPSQRESGSPVDVPYLTRQSGIPVQSEIPISSAFRNGQPQARPSGMSFGGYGMQNGSPRAPEGENGTRTVTVCGTSSPSASA